ncbi:MAG: hypothetical protein M1822_001438 [Bathelium mastoideum]|nr:MAG: hypothetical protein M1822_001438 [Bathelium mastoideum]
MQRVLGRTASAKRQAARRLAKERLKKFKVERYEELLANHAMSSTRATMRREARMRQNEDWQLGPLAPRRDVGQAAESYGTTNTTFMRPPNVPERHRLKHWLVREGDRVVIIKGRDQGKIGDVSAIDEEKETVQIRGLNRIEVEIPAWMRKQDGDTRTTRVMSAPISVKDVRLVHAYLDPDTNIQRDVIVEEVKMCDFWRDPVTKEASYSREIEGLPTSEPAESDGRPQWERIPWPEMKNDEPEKADQDSDTLRITVDEKSFVPTLLRPPMPPSVLDELRNKYSKFRDRHDPEYIATKEAEDLETDARKQMPEWMLQPSRELRERAKNKEKIIKPAVPDLISEEDFLARVGQLMSERTSSQVPLAAK